VIGTFRANGYIGPIVFAIETIFNNGAVNAAVASGVQAAVALSFNVSIGPNLDTLLASGDKYDGTHPNYAGETKLASAWASAIAGLLQ
jgi:hypothetical protein